MHMQAAEAILESVRRREREGDCPREPAHGTETLEGCLIEIANQRQRLHDDFAALDALVLDDDELGEVTFSSGSKPDGFRIVNLYIGHALIPVGIGQTVREAVQHARQQLANSPVGSHGLDKEGTT